MGGKIAAFAAIHASGLLAVNPGAAAPVRDKRLDPLSEKGAGILP
jgi:hypothetical protein